MARAMARGALLFGYCFWLRSCIVANADHPSRKNEANPARNRRTTCIAAWLH
jgi:hypothetical protein